MPRIFGRRVSQVYKALVQILNEDSGSSAAEYGLVAGLVAIVVITGVMFAGNTMGGFFNYIGSEVANVLPSGSTLLK